jgi:hypothetical protein
MGRSRQTKRSELFLVRLWLDEATDGEIEWRGKVQRAVTGEAYYFQDLPQLPELLRLMMPDGSQDREAHPSEPDLTRE